MSTTKDSKRILSVKVEKMIDDSPDTSWLGEFSDEPKEFAIVAAGEHEGTFLDELPCETCGKLEGEHTDCDDGLGDSLRGDYEFDCATENHCHEFDQVGIPRGREYRYFNPGSVEKFNPNTEGATNDNAAERAIRWRKDMRDNAQADYKRMRQLNAGDFCFIGIDAKAKVQLAGDLCQTITSGGLWGIESDSGDDYLC